MAPTEQIPSTEESPSTDQTKHNLHWLIETVDNPAVLQAVEILLSQQIPPASFGLRDSIDKALAESKTGQGRPHEEVWPELCAEFGVKL